MESSGEWTLIFSTNFKASGGITSFIEFKTNFFGGITSFPFDLDWIL